MRSSGPGGQNVNKVATKALLRWKVAESPSLSAAVRKRFLERFGRRIDKAGILELRSQRFRDRGRNVADCLERLRAMLLEVATPPKKRVPTRPTRGSQERRLQGKQKRSRIKKLRRRPGSEDA